MIGEISLAVLSLISQTGVYSTNSYNISEDVKYELCESICFEMQESFKEEWSYD